jgi:serine/threonine protein kinase
MDDKRNKFGSWILHKIICDNHKSIIYDVMLDVSDNNVNDDDVKELENKKWILKGIKNETEEINIINILQLYKNDNSRNFNIVKMPSNSKHRYGYVYNNNIYMWCVMEKYDNDIGQELDYCINNYKKIMLYLLNFVEWLHTTKKLIYGDIKLPNIVLNKIEDKLSIIDFESIDVPNNIICSSGLPDGYYYYGFGCDNNISYYSYKSELQIIGYMLCHILEQPKQMRWRDISFDYYKKNIKQNNFIYLNILKELHYKNMPEIVKKYFEIIKNLDWRENNIDPSIYTELKKLFN